MDIDEWLSKFEVIAAGDLSSQAAALLIAFVERHASHIATVVERAVAMIAIS